MSTEDVLGLLIGSGTLLAALGYLADAYFHPERFKWLELPQTAKKNPSPTTDIHSSHRSAA